MKKTVRLLQKICRVLELVVAIFVLLGIMTAIISLLKDDIRIFEEVLNDMTAFRHYLEKIFVLVIGIEFLEMLCHPNSDNVIQVLIFLVARHMIVGETTPFEDFVSVLSIAVLIVLRKYMHASQKIDSDEDRS
ncbi:MAG: hypothetical protein K2P69_13505 [Eubacterium sp.]|nr:hypothetical protein [Eubacterium sp.]